MSWLFQFVLALLALMLGLESIDRTTSALEPPPQRNAIAALLRAPALPIPPPPPPPPPIPHPADPLGGVP